MRKETLQQISFGDGFIDPVLYELDEELKRDDVQSMLQIYRQKQ